MSFEAGRCKFDWTKERIERLRDLHAQGYSYSIIAFDLGDGVTRNACIGKALRIGLAKRGKSPGEGFKKIAKPRNTQAKPKPRNVHVQRLVRASLSGALRFIDSVECEEMPISEMPIDDIPVKQRKQLVDLAHNDCRWPYGDPVSADFFFCGGIKEKGYPYCVMHARVAYGRKQLAPDHAQKVLQAKRSTRGRIQRTSESDWIAA